MLIEILSGPLKGKRMNLAPGIYILGRGVGPLPFQDLGLSHEHAKLHIFSNRQEIEDLQSTNGTFLNDQPISRSLIEPGDIIRLGPEACFQFLSVPLPLASEPPLQTQTNQPLTVTASLKNSDKQHVQKRHPLPGKKIKFVHILIVILFAVIAFIFTKYFIATP